MLTFMTYIVKKLFLGRVSWSHVGSLDGKSRFEISISSELPVVKPF